MLQQFDLAIAQSLYNSQDAFPVDFDNAWAWCGYSRKDNALANFQRGGFDEGVDFSFPANSGKLETQEGRPIQKIFLTIDCLKTWAMMVQTEAGKRVRRYFLDCEKAVKASSKEIAALREQIASVKVESATGIFEQAEWALISLLGDLKACKGDPLATHRIAKSIDSINAVLSRNKTAQTASTEPTIVYVKEAMSQEQRKKISDRKKANTARRDANLWIAPADHRALYDEVFSAPSFSEVSREIQALRIDRDFHLCAVKRAIFSQQALSKPSNRQYKLSGIVVDALLDLGFRKKSDSRLSAELAAAYEVKETQLWGRV